MLSKSIVIFYTYNNGIQLLIGKHKIYNDKMFIGGGQKKGEDRDLCVSREIFEETRKIFGTVKDIYNLISEQTLKCGPFYINRLIERNNKTINLKLRINICFVRIPYMNNINELFQKRVIKAKCYNELSDIIWINIRDLNMIKEKEFFSEDVKVIEQLKKYNIYKLIEINDNIQKTTLNYQYV